MGEPPAFDNEPVETKEIKNTAERRLCNENKALQHRTFFYI